MRPVQPDYGLAEARACPDCVTDCQEPSCTAAEMTSQCTDQCVVVACTDPTHGEMSCHAPMPCDATCDGMEVCSDSTGFDDVVSTSSTGSVCLIFSISTRSCNVALIIIHIYRIRELSSSMARSLLEVISPSSMHLLMHFYANVAFQSRTGNSIRR